MVLKRVEQREIVEVLFKFPDGYKLKHPALVLSTKHLSDKEKGMFYAVLISSKNIFPEYTLQIESDWLEGNMDRDSYFVTHIVSFFTVKDILSTKNTFVKEKYFNRILYRVIDSMFDLEVSEEE